ncbi:MAG: PQQ-binding-like beta-propeller repeat protein [Deltaproteobacteria bacterium]|nr:PQQ-binding-like beta-propeller repeat protein [Deltaproteobacteria bacterium]
MSLPLRRIVTQVAATVACVAAALAAASSGCGGGQTRGHPLDRRWSDADGTELISFQRDWAPKPPPPTRDLATGVARSGELVGRIPGQPTWQLARTIETGPLIARNIVVATGDGELIAVEGSSGDLMWSRPTVGRLRGADDDGEITVVSLETLDGQGTVVLAVGRDGRVIRQLDVPERVGAPAVLDGYAFLPWDERLVVIFDLAAGHEAARVVSDRRLRHAKIVDQTPFFGEHTLLAFDAHVVEARRGGGTTVELPTRRHLGRWPRQAIVSPATARSAAATGGITLHARPEVVADGTDGTAGRIAHDRYLATARSLAVGLDATDGSTRWVYVGSAPFLGGATGGGAFVVCDAGGSITWLAPGTGAVLQTTSLGAELTACAVQGKGTAPSRRRRGASSRHLPGRGGDDLAEQLARAIKVADPALLALQTELLADLDALSGDHATARLIEVASDPTVAPLLQTDARSRLARRRTGKEAMLEALDEATPGWLCSAPPLARAELAQALSALGERRAASLLPAHLRCVDPRSADAVAITQALGELGDEQQRWALRWFAVRHYCDTADSRSSNSVFFALEALVRMGDLGMARRIANDSCTGRDLRRRLGSLLERTSP